MVTHRLFSSPNFLESIVIARTLYVSDSEALYMPVSAGLQPPSHLPLFKDGLTAMRPGVTRAVDKQNHSKIVSGKIKLDNGTFYVVYLNVVRIYLPRQPLAEIVSNTFAAEKYRPLLLSSQQAHYYCLCDDNMVRNRHSAGFLLVIYWTVKFERGFLASKIMHTSLSFEKCFSCSGEINSVSTPERGALDWILVLTEVHQKSIYLPLWGSKLRIPDELVATIFEISRYMYIRNARNPVESPVCDVFRQLNVLHQAASCSSYYDIRDIQVRSAEKAPNLPPHVYVDSERPWNFQTIASRGISSQGQAIVKCLPKTELATMENGRVCLGKQEVIWVVIMNNEPLHCYGDINKEPEDRLWRTETLIVFVCDVSCLAAFRSRTQPFEVPLKIRVKKSDCRIKASYITALISYLVLSESILVCCPVTSRRTQTNKICGRTLFTNVTTRQYAYTEANQLLRMFTTRVISVRRRVLNAPTVSASRETYSVRINRSLCKRALSDESAHSTINWSSSSGLDTGPTDRQLYSDHRCSIKHSNSFKSRGIRRTNSSVLRVWQTNPLKRQRCNQKHGQRQQIAPSTVFRPNLSFRETGNVKDSVHPGGSKMLADDIECLVSSRGAQRNE
ncbi:hypothetical protein CLF_106057 [Clonorchis sinensis]|uniref:Uncharacterized protein n=1 Tax=Clonorchis sinensis TaxID=79923 RepID=G7YEM5_CLOSI|nr:hypothetical protein CLF_106057 [Clonorchis sinensis]